MLAAAHTRNRGLDGEVCSLDADGRPRFGRLQSDGGEFAYFVFDLQELDGVPVVERPLSERRALLERTVPEPSDRVRRSEVFDDGEALLAAARKQRLEGIVSKRDASP